MRDFGSVVKQLQSETAQGFPIDFRGEVHSLEHGLLSVPRHSTVRARLSQISEPRLNRNRLSPSWVLRCSVRC